MAQLLIVKSETGKQGLQFIGDVADVLHDGRWLSPGMLEEFNVLIIDGSVADVNARLNQIIPLQSRAIMWDSDSKYHFYSIDPPQGVVVFDPIDVFLVGDKWYKIENDFKYPLNVHILTPEEKQLLATNINNPAVDRFINKLVKDLTTQDGNDVEIEELGNAIP
jgi:hypothetical protein